MNTEHNLPNKVNETIKGKPIALKGARRVWARRMGKHAYREVRRCPLFLLHVGARSQQWLLATRPITIFDNDTVIQPIRKKGKIYC
jgi:hypothetical protein